MLTPAELARIVENYDEANWYEFLDELDTVSRRRRERQTGPEPLTVYDQLSMSAWVARQHFFSDSGIREIWCLHEGAPPDEIRLIEVNDRLAGPATPGKGIEALEFALDRKGKTFRLFVADVTSEEMEEIKAGRLSLPSGWILIPDKVMVWRRKA